MTMTTTVLHVTGMTCDHCVRAVTEELSAVPGVHDIGVELQPDGASRVTLTSDDPLDPGALAAAVDEAGYSLTAATA